MKRKQWDKIKPFEAVLARDSADDPWDCAFFSHLEKDTFVMCGGNGKDHVAPFRGNEHLIGVCSSDLDYFESDEEWLRW